MTVRERLRVLSASDNFQRSLMALAAAMNLVGLTIPPYRLGAVQVLCLTVIIVAQVMIERRRREHARWKAERRARSDNPARDDAIDAWMARQHYKDVMTIIEWNLHLAVGDRDVDDAPPIVREYLTLRDEWARKQ